MSPLHLAFWSGGLFVVGFMALAAAGGQSERLDGRLPFWLKAIMLAGFVTAVAGAMGLVGAALQI